MKRQILDNKSSTLKNDTLSVLNEEESRPELNHSLSTDVLKLSRAVELSPENAGISVLKFSSMLFFVNNTVRELFNCR